MIDDRVNQTARRVAIHQAIDEIVDARRSWRFDPEPPQEALRIALIQLAHIAFDPHPDPHPDTVEHAWQALAAIAQGQLEQAMEARAR